MVSEKKSFESVDRRRTTELSRNCMYEVYLNPPDFLPFEWSPVVVPLCKDALFGFSFVFLSSCFDAFDESVLRHSDLLHRPSMLAVKAEIYGVLYNQSSSIAFDETCSYWLALKSSYFLDFSVVTTR